MTEKQLEQYLTEEPEDVIVKTWLHHVMVALDIPAGWPAWVMVGVGLLLAIAAAGLWRQIAGQGALAVAAVLALFMALDAAVLVSLPQKGLSYGPWQSQFTILALFRALAVVGLSLVGFWLGWSWGLTLVLMSQVIGTVALLWGATVEPFRLGLSELTITTDRLPAGAPPIRLLHISDLHVERLTRREEAVVQLANEVKPDVIIITGDYVNLSYNCDPTTHAQVRQLLSRLSAPYGVYATLGSPTVDLREMVVPIFDGLPIHLMRHHWQRLDLGEGRQLALLGMDCTHNILTDEVRLAHLVRGIPNDLPLIFLYHSPELMPQAVQHEIDLYLCGHTHGGQVRLPLLGPIFTSSKLGRRYVMGLYRHGRTHLYVSRGVGLEGLSAPRVRFLAPPEVTLVTLKAE